MTDSPFDLSADAIDTIDLDQLLAGVDFEGEVALAEAPRPEPQAPIAAVRVDRKAPAAAPEWVYTFQVRNDRPVPMHDVRVEHDVPDGVRILGAKPRAQLAANGLAWKLGTLAPGEQITLRIKCERGQDGGSTAPATGSFRVSHAATEPICAPLVLLALDGPDRIGAGETGEWVAEVLNDGTGPADNVRLVIDRGPGLVGPDGETATEVPIGTLGAGEAVAVTFGGRGTVAGPNPVRLTASADGLADATAELAAVVTAPCLTVGCAAPAAWILGHDADVSVSVRNEGTAPARAVRVTLALPPGLEVVRWPEGLEYDPAGGSLSTQLDVAPDGFETTFALVLRATSPGDWTGTAEAVGDGLDLVRASFVAAVDFDVSARDPFSDLVAETDRAFERIAGPAGAEHHAVPEAVGVRSVVFAIGATHYALPLDSVVEIGAPLPVTPVPHMPAWIAGVANCRGDIVSIVDLCRFAGVAEAPSRSRRLVHVRGGTGSDLAAGMLVDSVVGIQSVPAELSPMADLRAHDPLSAVAVGAALTDSGLIVVLKPTDLLTATAVRDGGL